MENKNYDKRNYLDVFNRDVKLRNIKANINSRKNSMSFRNMAGKINMGYNTMNINSARTMMSSTANNPEQAKAKAGRSFKEKFNMYGYKKSDVVLAHNAKPNNTQSQSKFAKRAGSVPRVPISRPTASTNVGTISPNASTKN